MNKQLITTYHTEAVNARKKVYAETQQNNDNPEHDSHARLKSIEREISVLGQVHNPRISAKSLAAIMA